jgi:hypothetical protein
MYNCPFYRSGVKRIKCGPEPQATKLIMFLTDGSNHAEHTNHRSDHNYRSSRPPLMHLVIMGSRLNVTPQEMTDGSLLYNA